MVFVMKNTLAKFLAAVKGCLLRAMITELVLDSKGNLEIPLCTLKNVVMPKQDVRNQTCSNQDRAENLSFHADGSKPFTRSMQKNQQQTGMEGLWWMLAEEHSWWDTQQLLTTIYKPTKWCTDLANSAMLGLFQCINIRTRRKDDNGSVQDAVLKPARY